MLRFPETDFTRRVGLRHPILQAPNDDVQLAPHMIVMFGKTGGLGCLGAKDLSPKQIVTTVSAIQKMAKNPFAVHLARYDESDTFLTQLETLQKLKVPAICLEGTLPPEPLLRKLRLQKTVLIGIAATRQQLHTLMEGNLDFLVYLGTMTAFGFEKNHPSLLPLFKRSPVPLLAACPTFNRHSITQWLALGATGIQIGLPYSKVGRPKKRKTPITTHPRQPLAFPKV